MTKSKISRAHCSTRRRRKLRKEIKEAIRISVITLIGSVAIAALFFGAVVQESEKLAVMYAAEVAE